MPEDLIERLKVRIQDPEGASDLADSKAYDPISLTSIEKAERELGFSFPPLLRQVYTQVGDGGWGPGCGLYFLHYLVERYQERHRENRSYLDEEEDCPEDAKGRWPAGMLEICEWGCDIYSCIDCMQDDGPIYRMEPEWRQVEGATSPLLPEADSLQVWLEYWLDEAQYIEDDPNKELFALPLYNPEHKCKPFEKDKRMSSDSFVLFFGIRYEVTDESEVELLEKTTSLLDIANYESVGDMIADRLHPTVNAALTAGLEWWWGRNNPGKWSYFLLIGKDLGHLGWERDHNLQVPASELVTVMNQVREKLASAGVTKEPSLHAGFQGDM